jgi:hypothetical protein
LIARVVERSAYPPIIPVAPTMTGAIEGAIRLLDHRGTVSGFGDILETAAMNAENENK